MARRIGMLFFLLFFAGTASAQQYAINVQWMVSHPDDPDFALNTELGHAFIQELELRGIPREGTGLMLYTKAQSHPMADGEIIVLSIVETYGMGDEMVDAGAKAQIFYAGKPLPENLEEGRVVREYMTREILKNQVHVTGIIQLVFPRTDVSRAISDYLDELDHRIQCNLPDSDCD